ncbi:hypothetical protein BJ742DRAFT_773201 [Cladochytrium replicatum]|nr:hypothetical protein BJ742DRAFT_773201 [Cladochytrium replicatum]
MSSGGFGGAQKGMAALFLVQALVAGGMIALFGYQSAFLACAVNGVMMLCAQAFGWLGLIKQKSLYFALHMAVAFLWVGLAAYHSLWIMGIHKPYFITDQAAWIGTDLAKKYAAAAAVINSSGNTPSALNPAETSTIPTVTATTTTKKLTASPNTTHKSLRVRGADASELVNSEFVEVVQVFRRQTNNDNSSSSSSSDMSGLMFMILPAGYLLLLILLLTGFICSFVLPLVAEEDDYPPPSKGNPYDGATLSRPGAAHTRDGNKATYPPGPADSETLRPRQKKAVSIYQRMANGKSGAAGGGFGTLRKKPMNMGYEKMNDNNGPQKPTMMRGDDPHGSIPNEYFGAGSWKDGNTLERHGGGVNNGYGNGNVGRYDDRNTGYYGQNRPESAWPVNNNNDNGRPESVWPTNNAGGGRPDSAWDGHNKGGRPDSEWQGGRGRPDSEWQGGGAKGGAYGRPESEWQDKRRNDRYDTYYNDVRYDTTAGGAKGSGGTITCQVCGEKLTPKGAEDHYCEGPNSGTRDTYYSPPPAKGGNAPGGKPGKKAPPMSNKVMTKTEDGPSKKDDRIIRRAIANYVPNPDMGDEIELLKDDEVEILEQYEDGWAFGLNLETNQSGAFPLSCLEAVDSRPQKEAKKQRVQSLMVAKRKTNYDKGRNSVYRPRETTYGRETMYGGNGRETMYGNDRDTMYGGRETMYGNDRETMYGGNNSRDTYYR